jgi:hypothetical protein
VCITLDIFIFIYIYIHTLYIHSSSVIHIHIHSSFESEVSLSRVQHSSTCCREEGRWRGKAGLRPGLAVGLFSFRLNVNNADTIMTSLTTALAPAHTVSPCTTNFGYITASAHGAVERMMLIPKNDHPSAWNTMNRTPPCNGW